MHLLEIISLLTLCCAVSFAAGFDIGRRGLTFQPPITITLVKCKRREARKVTQVINDCVRKNKYKAHKN